MASIKNRRSGLRSGSAAPSIVESEYNVFAELLLSRHAEVVTPKHQSVFESYGITTIKEDTLHAANFTPPHILHDGTDINMTYSLEADEHVVPVDSYMHGTYEIYILNKSNEFTVLQPTHRFSMPTNGIPTFVRTSCLVKFRQFCSGSVVAISRHEGGSWTPTRLGIIEGIWYNNVSGSKNNCIKYYESNGLIDADGIPVVLKCKCWEDMKKHLIHHTSCLDTVKFHFINQVRGLVPLGGEISAATRSTKDGAIQSSKYGGDKWDIPQPNLNRSLNINVSMHRLTSSISCHKDLFVKNNSQKLRKRRRSSLAELKSHPKVTSEFMAYIKPKTYIQAHDQIGIVFVVKTQDDQFLPPKQAQHVPQVLDKKLCIGSIASASNNTSPLQEFFCLSKTSLSRLKNEYQNGVKLEQQSWKQQLDSILMQYSDGVYTCISAAKVVNQYPPPHNSFDGYCRIFAGKGAPEVDTSFTSLTHHEGLSIYFKYVNAREYNEYSPISMGFFDSKTHGVHIQDWMVETLQRPIGAKGTYSSGRNCMKHDGFLTYAGPRKRGNMRQPTVAEGPNESNIPEEDRYHFSNINVCHKYWPFAHKLINTLVGATTQAAYHIYPFLAKFYPVSNSINYRNKFCPRGIIALNFASSCHVDKNDNLKKYYQNVVGRLTQTIELMQTLNPIADNVIGPKLIEATNSLQHLIWWGLCLPTTCCYQYVKQRNNIEVYQWFVCPGLGTAHKIENFWVHLFLAALFSHYTTCAIYIVDGKAYFGNCPYATMFSWGGT